MSTFLEKGTTVGLTIKVVQRGPEEGELGDCREAWLRSVKVDRDVGLLGNRRVCVCRVRAKRVAMDTGGTDMPTFC